MPKRRAFFICGLEHSSFNAAMAVAEPLKAFGHDAVFIGDHSDRFRTHVERNGFEYVALGPKEVLYGELPGPLEAAKRARRFIAEIVDSVERFTADERSHVDLAFLDVGITWPACHFLSVRRVPTISLVPNYASRFDVSYPPVWSDKAPTGAGLRAKADNFAAWAKLFLKRQALSWKHPKGMLFAAILRRYLRTTKRNGWRFGQCEWGTRALLPEIVIGHKDLDWPAVHSDNRLYIASAAFKRNDSDSDWRRQLDPHKPLIYAGVSTLLGDATSFGDAVSNGQSSLDVALPAWIRPIERYLNTLIDAFVVRSDWQLLLSCGFLSTRIAASRVLPPNVQIANRVAQLDALKAASVAITQGGAQSVRECAWFGVPMLVFPQWTDQYGNAARVASRHLGLNGGRIHGLTADRVISLVDRLLTDRQIRSAASAFADRCQSELPAEPQRLKAFVERHAQISL
jgi:hypothetical protein